MKKVVTLAAALLTATLYAAPADNKDMQAALKARQEQMLQAIQKELGLSDAQTKKWAEIQDRYIQAHLKLQTEQNGEINALLTDEQRKKFEEMQQRFRERLNQRMGGEK